MAENEQPDDSSASTPNSTTTGNNRELKAAKDRNCPFCGQAFTSSSLGRHLDLYIKPKNPKPPDGVHDVNEIRKLRGGITRRQPRTSLKEGAREGSVWSGTNGNTKPAKTTEAKMPAAAAAGEEENATPNGRDEHLRTWINAPTWHATGVINDLPARVPSRPHSATPTGQAQRAQEMRRDATGGRIERPEYGAAEEVWKLQESAEVGKAAEMALREVLGSLEAAKKKAEPRALFEDFDFCSLSFPGLCLAILPPPGSLFSTTPFPHANTWSLSPPGEKESHVLSRMLNERVTMLRKGKIENVPDSIGFKHHVHLQGAYEHWQNMSESDKASAWNLELSRAFVREREKKQQFKADLENAEQRIQHLEAEYDRLSRCQLPREYLLHPPQTTPVSPAVMREFGSSANLHSGAADVNYDADALINKWKASVKSTTRQTRAPTQPANTYVESRRNPLKADMMLSGSVFGVNGPMPREGVQDYSGGGNHGGITYETPQRPGAVMDAEEEGDEEEAGALMRLRDVNGVVNSNGKRPFGGGGGGEGRGVKQAKG